MIFILNQWHKKFGKSQEPTIGQNTGKSDFFCMTLRKTRAGVGGGGGVLFYSKTVQVSFWNMET